jgi:hypothetical protein
MHIPRLVCRARRVRASLWIGAGLALLLAGPAAATKYAGAFMENGGGARALAMGGAFTAVADDPSTTFWNPAGLASVTSRQILLMHAERFGDLIDRDFAVYVQPVGWNLLGGEAAGIGLTVIRLGIDDIPFTAHLASQLDTNGDGDISAEELTRLFDLRDQIRYESDQELALLLSYGERLGAWKFGATLKFIRQSVGEYSSFGIGADLALLRRGVWRNLDVGLKLQDITTTYLAWDSPEGKNELILPAIVPALAYRWPLPDWNLDVVLAASLETRLENRRSADQYWIGSASANAHVGAEVGFSKRVFLRGGFDSGWQAEHLTAGAGFKLPPLTVDYAYAGDTLDIDEVTHRISLSVEF